MDVKHDKPKMDRGSKYLYSTSKRFREYAELMFIGPLTNKEVQCNYFVLWIGETGRKIFNAWTLTNDEKKKLSIFTVPLYYACSTFTFQLSHPVAGQLINKV